MQDKFGNKVTDPADPNRCQAAARRGQCEYKKVEGTPYCPRHSGLRTQAKNDRKAAQMYNLKMWRARLDELKDTPESKTLGTEVAILRMTLEAALNKCTSTDELFLMSSTIGDLAIKIEKVLKSAHSMDQSSGNLMDKSKAIAFAGTVVEIVDRVLTLAVTDVELRERIVDEISQGILTSLQKPDDNDNQS